MKQVAFAIVLATRWAGAEDVEVVVRGDAEDSLPRNPGSANRLRERELERMHPIDAAEALNRIPGVVARQDTGAGQRLDISIRGVDAGRSRRVLILEDGIPIALNPYGEPDLYYSTPIERTRAIEVVKGSANVLYGPQTIGGVVNFLTWLPEDRTKTTLDIEGGERAYARGLVRYGTGTPSVRYVVQAFHKLGDGFRDEAFSSTDGFGRVAFDTRAGEFALKLGVHQDLADSDAVGLTRQMYADDAKQPSIAPNDRLRLERYEAALVHSYAAGEHTFLRTMLYGNTLTRMWRRQNYSREPAPGASYERVLGDPTLPAAAIYFLPTDTVLDRDYQVAGIEERVEQRFRTGPIAHTLDFGARTLFERAHYRQLSGETPTAFSGELGFEEMHRGFALAAYVQDRLAVGKALVATLGTRFERAIFRRQITRQTDETGSHDVDVSGTRSASAVIPGVGLLAGGRDAHAFAGMHVGWAPPRYAASVSPRGTPAELGTERSINYELGARLRIARALRLETTGFLSDFQNQIVIDTTPGAGAMETDAGHTRRYGVENEATLTLPRFARTGMTLELALRYTFNRAVFVDSPNAGRILPYAPIHTGGACLDLEHASGVAGEIAYSYTSSQFTDAANTVAEDATGTVGRITPHSTLDLGASYRNAPTGLSFRVVVKNASDDVYVVARRPDGIFVAGFRQVILGVRWDYDAGPRS